MQEKTSRLTFPLLKVLVLESKQPLSLRTSSTAQSTMEVVFKICYVQRERRHTVKMLERNGGFEIWKVQQSKRHRFWVQPCHRPTRHPAELGPSLCLPCELSVQMTQMSEGLFILIRPQSGAWGHMWKRNSDRLDELGVCQNSPPHWLCRHNYTAYFFGQMDLRIKRILGRKKGNITAHLSNEVLFMFCPLALQIERPLFPQDVLFCHRY